ncbi:ABC transporter ATP-binding protein [Nocardioides luteus]|uniref:ABC transporter ATP-binding protein n=2 Tax=Nocardioides luteus TaxID=1844 RepID=A0ABQ5SQ16_9ACTN|nr:ABC transporter ATP-binding protein [Nocardioides luteus]GGR44258.1 ABC transporter ATP-binding protein [Nocardioides luteus]GLJ66140.1 ABC transporter ATP-binding protein [Nocardioides luteus]
MSNTTAPASAATTTATTDPKIRIRGLSKHFSVPGGHVVTALDSFDLDVPQGQFLTIVGPSGCGKTTFLRMLAGLESPSEGSIEVVGGTDGRPENAMVFQGDSIFPWMSVWDNAAYGLTVRGVPKAQVKETVGHYLEATGLTKFADAFPHQLSGGMRQRVSIARAFANDPEILLMDEPFSALDEQNKTLLQAELLRIWDETRKTVVFITHSVDEAVTLSDRIMVMSAQPGRAKAFIDVPFERPRDVLQLRHQPEYGEIVYDIWSQLKEEVEKAKQQADARVAPKRHGLFRR